MSYTVVIADLHGMSYTLGIFDDEQSGGPVQMLEITGGA